MAKINDLESKIMDCWSITDGIKTLREISDVRKIGNDELQNALLGIETLYNMKFELLFTTFEAVLHNARPK